MIIQLEIPKEFAKDYANNRFDTQDSASFRDSFSHQAGHRFRR